MDSKIVYSCKMKKNWTFLFNRGMLQAYVDNFKTTFPYTAPPTDGQSAVNMGMLIDGNN